ncbi:peptidase S8/S53 domain-containing protein [Schizophyllum amplum]|uniref:tripeptidyl-peptidase II n=1 Tax=Schizophyllum amplum TaxID=97359 RepID=A0A550CTC9_9AGAR|nr:peptidase S8/S53 domain-containing protein [Auriculariopsis ampla]
MNGLTWRTLLSLVLAAAAVASPTKRADYRIKQTVNAPSYWVQQSSAPEDHVIRLRIGLPQPNFHLLEEAVYAVSDPMHRSYGKHLSKEEVEQLIAPHDASLDAVNEWLAEYGLQEEHIERSPARDWVIINIPVGLAEDMLDTTYSVWKNAKTDETMVRTTAYSLPASLHSHIETVQPTTMFATWSNFKAGYIIDDDFVDFPSFDSTPGAKASFAPAVNSIAAATTYPPVDASCQVNVTLSCLRQIYNISDYMPDASLNNSIATAGYLEEFANFEDLQSFYALELPEAVGTNFSVVSISGGLNNQSLEEAGAEANLDVQFAYGLAWPINATYYTTGGRPPFVPDLSTTENTNEPYNDWLDYVLALDEVPLVISTSYGEHEQTIPEDYARRACASLAQLAARGVTLTFSSGDNGVGDGEIDPESHTCYSNDGSDTYKFLPAFPASCPFVTAVGGTTIVNGLPEVAVSRFFSGSGFSDYFERPEYQADAVQAYIDAMPEGANEGLFNTTGRGYPDIAALGDYFLIYLSGTPRRIGGTSASSPAFAAVIALLNDARLKAGLSPLGFLNPLIYSLNGYGFNDITVGNSTGCGTTGFNCTPGWDPVTGFGTPNFGLLKDYVLSLE